MRNGLPLPYGVLVTVRGSGVRQVPGASGGRNFGIETIKHLESVPLIGNGDVFASMHAFAGEAVGLENPLEATA